ncbi:MAG: YfhO family protein [Planctomycetota bacterium]|nr:YfhO family protein [Planctomycetota bacterium]
MSLLRSSRMWLIALLAAGLLISFYDVAFLGRTLATTNFAPGTTPFGSWGYSGRPGYPWDIPVLDAISPPTMHEPDARLGRERFWRGELPLWNPHLAYGMPWLADMPTAVLFPPQWVLHLSDAPWAWDAYMLLRLLLAGVFAALYLRLMGLGMIPSLFGAYAYMLCGFHVWNVNIAFVNSSLCLPLLLYGAERVVRSPSAGSIAWLGVAMALQVLGGTPEPSAMALLFGAAYVLYRCGTMPERKRLLASRLVGAALATLLGMGISAPLWIPFLESLAIAYHEHGTWIGQLALPLRSLPLLVAPDMFGPLHARWDGTTPVSDPGYAGATVTILALAAVVGGVGRRRPWAFFTATALFCLLKIYGLPGFNWLIGSLPIFNRVFITRFLSPVLYFSLAVLASAAMGEILAGRRGGLRTGAIGILGFLALALWAFWGPASQKEAGGVLLVGILAPLLVALATLLLAEGCRRGRIGTRPLTAALMFLLVLDLFLPIPRTRLDRADPFREPPYIRFLKEARAKAPFRVFGQDNILLPNTAQAYGLDDIGGHAPMFPDRTMQWMREVMGLKWPHQNLIRGDVIPDIDRAGADLSNLRYVITHRDRDLRLEDGPRSEVLPGNIPRGEILPGQAPGQTFLCSENNLSAVSVFLATYARENRGILEFRLHEESPGQEPLRTVRVRMEEIENNAYFWFPFDPIPESKGNRYAFTLASPDASSGNAVTVWMHPEGRYPDGVRLESGEPAAGDLGFGIHFVSPGSRFRVAHWGEVTIFENRLALPRAYVVPRATWVSEQREALQQIGASGFEPRRSVILERGDGAGLPPEGAGPTWSADGSRASIEEYGANRVKISVDAEGAGFLVLLDAFYPGWKVTVNGESRTIYAANGLFRAVRVDPGPQIVEFKYMPLSFLLGLTWAMGSIVGMTALMVLRRRRRPSPIL